MTYTDTLLIDGTDVHALPGVTAVDFIDGLYAPLTRRGDDLDVPRRDGSSGQQLPLAKYVITVPMWVRGATTGALNANLRDLYAAVMGTNGLVTLTRKLDYGAGLVSHTAPGRFIPSASFVLVNHETGHVDLQFYNLNGFWLNGSTRVYP